MRSATISCCTPRARLSDAESAELRSRLATGSPEEIGALAEADAVLALSLALARGIPVGRREGAADEEPAVARAARLLAIDAHVAAGPTTLVGPSATLDGARRRPVLIFAVSLVMVMNAHRGKEELRRPADPCVCRATGHAADGVGDEGTVAAEHAGEADVHDGHDQR